MEVTPRGSKFVTVRREIDGTRKKKEKGKRETAFAHRAKINARKISSTRYSDSRAFDRRRAEIYSGEYFGGGKEKYGTLDRKTAKKHVRSDRAKIARFDSRSINRYAFR